MKRLLLLAGLALALFSSAPSIANGWVRNPADRHANQAKGLWVIVDSPAGDDYPAGTHLHSPYAYSPDGEVAFFYTKCACPLISVHFRPANDLTIPYLGKLPSKLWGELDSEIYKFSVLHKHGNAYFFTAVQSSYVFRRAIRDELPVKIEVPIYQGPDAVFEDAVFEWDMKGGAAAWEEACP